MVFKPGQALQLPTDILKYTDLEFVASRSPEVEILSMLPE
jgi:hypothetical protein